MVESSRIYTIPMKSINSRDVIVHLRHALLIKGCTQWGFSKVEFISRSAAQELAKIVNENNSSITFHGLSSENKKLLGIVRDSKPSAVRNKEITFNKVTLNSL